MEKLKFQRNNTISSCDFDFKTYMGLLSQRIS